MQRRPENSGELSLLEMARIFSIKYLQHQALSTTSFILKNKQAPTLWSYKYHGALGGDVERSEKQVKQESERSPPARVLQGTAVPRSSVVAQVLVPITEAAALTCSVVFGLILFTIWARKRGHDLSFLADLLERCIKAFLRCYLIQLYFPQWRIFMLLGNGFKALGSCICIVYCSSCLMRHSSSADSILVLSINIAIVCLFFSFMHMAVIFRELSNVNAGH